MSNPYWIGDISLDAERIPGLSEGDLVTLSMLAQVERIDTEKIEVTDFCSKEPEYIDGATRVTLSIRTLYRDGRTIGAERLASI